MTETAADTLRVAIRLTTSEWAEAEKPRPSSSFGMIMPKNLCSFRKAHAASGMSIISCSISKSSSMAQNSATGPSRKACSSSV